MMFSQWYKGFPNKDSLKRLAMVASKTSITREGFLKTISSKLNLLKIVTNISDHLPLVSKSPFENKNAKPASAN